jgi:branched-chain amino acid transport system substrate-binding protein
LQYAWDSTVVVAKLYQWLGENNLPATGENLRKALLTIRTFDLPMTGKLVVTDDHRVDKPVYLYVVKNGQFTLLDTIA